MLILLDQDGVLADFELGVYRGWQALGAAHPPLPHSERRNFRVRDDYPAHLRDAVESIYTAPGFFRMLPPIEGAIDAARELLALGHDVRICTSPLSRYRYCVPEKFEWVEQHLGADWVARLILTKDKTLVHGDVLVDDKPAVTGARAPAWRQVLFDQPYNRAVDGVRMDWSNWREVLLAS